MAASVIMVVVVGEDVLSTQAKGEQVRSTNRVAIACSSTSNGSYVTPSWWGWGGDCSVPEESVGRGGMVWLGVGVAVAVGIAEVPVAAAEGEGAEAEAENEAGAAEAEDQNAPLQRDCNVPTTLPKSNVLVGCTGSDRLDGVEPRWNERNRERATWTLATVSRRSNTCRSKNSVAAPNSTGGGGCCCCCCCGCAASPTELVSLFVPSCCVGRVEDLAPEEKDWLANWAAPARRACRTAPLSCSLTCTSVSGSSTSHVAPSSTKADLNGAYHVPPTSVPANVSPSSPGGSTNSRGWSFPLSVT